ncbi:MAG: 2,3-bisphosphoglycerate-independent phosphoglycerate mutase, partial [Bacteroidia bacterium]
MKNAKQVALLILDGWGIGKNDPRINAIAKANIPFIKSLNQKYPHTTLRTSGEDVGLPKGQMGNSEVGHLNIGAGRVVYQQLVSINKAFEENKLETHPVLNEAFDYAKKNNKKIHFLGLVSNGGVHASMEHLKGLCSLAHRKNVENLFIHAFTDGRDTDPKSGLGFIKELEEHLAKTTGKIASVIGRYYAMDRDKRWERVKLAYDLLVSGSGEKSKSAQEAIKKSYANNITDEFIKPVSIVDAENKPLATIHEGDVVLFFNFRTDRGRELTQVLSQQPFPEFGMNPLKLHYITMTQYDQTYKDVKILFDEDNLSNTLGEVVEAAGKKQLRIAETEKYPHVTFFFSGGREKEFQGEKRIMIPSPKVATYDLQPEMSANEITEAVVNEINTKENDLIILNFANPDMVGHTGVFDAVVTALETIDKCTEKVVKACLENDYAVIIIADHGNADYMVNPDGTPNTAHTTNVVPCILLNGGENVMLRDGKLADVAPTILSLMG